MHTAKDKVKENTKDTPVLNIKMMSDEEWNRLAYLNYLERNSRQK